MKITTFCPLIVTNSLDKNLRLFESLGFKVAHKQNPKENVYAFTLKDDDGHQVDVVKADVEQDMMMIRMNVPDFDETYEMLQEQGFIMKGARVVETDSSKSAVVKSTTGFSFDLCHHKRNK